MKQRLVLLLLLLVGVGIVLGGCNDDDQKATVKVQISGTAATGAPLNTAVVTAVNSKGDKAGPVPVDADGTYTLSVHEGAPYLLKAHSEEVGITLFSYASGSFAANITPLTNLAIFVAAGNDVDLEVLFKTWKKNPLSESDVMTATRMVNANLAEVYDAHHLDASTYNFFETPFIAGEHGIDAVLDALEIVIDPEAPTMDTMISITSNKEDTIFFDLYADIEEYYLIDRITPEAAFEKVSIEDALLVCSYGDTACGEILMENALLKSELEQQMTALSKNQAIIFY